MRDMSEVLLHERNGVYDIPEALRGIAEHWKNITYSAVYGIYVLVVFVYLIRTFSN